MPGTQRPTDPSAIKAERFLCSHADRGDPGDEKKAVHGSKVIPPTVQPRIEEPGRQTGDPACNLRPLRGVTEGAGPGIVL